MKDKSKDTAKYLPPDGAKRREIQDWYEGGVLSMGELAKRFAVKTDAIKYWADRYGWTFAKRVPLQRIQTVEEKLTMAERLNFGAEERLQKLVDGANVAEKSMEKILKTLKKMAEKGKIVSIDDRQEIQAVVGSFLDDKRLELSYMQELAKVLGDYAPVRRELTGKGGTPLLGGRGGESKTRKQMEEELLTLVRRLNNATKLGATGSAGTGEQGAIKLLEPRPADNGVPADPF